MTGSITTTNTVMSLFAKHLRKRAEKTLFNTPVLYEFADKVPLPGKAGTTIFVPRSIQKNQVIALTEGAPIGPSATSAHYYSGTVVGYGAAKKYSDFLVMVHEIPTMISNDIEGMAKYCANKIDSLIAGVLSATTVGNYVACDGSAVQNSAKSTTRMKQRFLFDAATVLASNNAPTYSDGLYWAAIHPRGLQHLFVNTSAGATQLFGTTDFLQNSDVGAQKLARFNMGVLGNVRLFRSTNIKKDVEAGGLSTNASGYQTYVMGPGTVAAVDLATARLKTYVKPIGSAGADDPIDQKMTAGVKFYFVPVAMDTGNRLVRSVHGYNI